MEAKMKSLGINIGSSTIKLVILEDSKIVWKKVVDHEGNFLDTLKNTIAEADIPAGVPTLVTGTEGRYLLKINNVIESICLEEALKAIDEQVNAVVSLGGEDFIVYTIDPDGKIITNFSGNKCAAGTGEFFKQQLGRMDMVLDDIKTIPSDCKAQPISSRCSVFMKSDCTHKLNKSEATKGDIVLSLSDVMATKVVDFLKRAKIEKGKVLLAGGVTKNRYLVGYLKKQMPDIEFIIPEEASFFEAYGAALIAEKSGSELPEIEDMFKPHDIGFSRYESLKSAEDMVT